MMGRNNNNNVASMDSLMNRVCMHGNVFKSGYEQFETRVSFDKERNQIQEDENIERNHKGMDEEVQDYRFLRKLID